MSPDVDLGWNDALDASWRSIGAPGAPGRVARIDRGWSTVMRHATDLEPLRTRNLYVDVAIGDWVVPSDDDEQVEHIIERTSAFVRRASFEGDRFEADTLAANIDVVFLVHALGSAPNQRRLERELVLAFDSGATPVVVLTKADLVDDAEPARRELADVALGVPVLVASGLRGLGIDLIRAYAAGNRTLAFLGASGVGKSTLVNALLDDEVMDTGEVREADQRGRHTTVAAQLLRLPGEGWLIDTPGVRAVSLWLSGDGIERAFDDVFTLMDHCRFRDCKHDREPGCAVQAAISDGRLDAARLASLDRLVAEEAALEEEQERFLKRSDRRGYRPRR
ncbi:ribosome small subunit-dependent GTPase A [Ilumatobacter sp.]|uniref:ribosome small subunit-dependent GTPase A n=1 Tax=Ilumatobacter sp. TaxID=1967498 RepID=UPI003AF9813B